MNSMTLSGRQVVYSRITFRSFPLCDAASKKFFIDALAHQKALAGFEVYGFSIFSNQVYLLTGKFGSYMPSDARRDLEDLLSYFLQSGSLGKDDLDAYYSSPAPVFSTKQLHTRKEVLDSLIYLHLVAMNLHYIQVGLDYWWTSVHNYRNKAPWTGVDSSVICEWICPDPDKARRRLIRMHHDSQRRDNPIPACLLDLEYRSSAGNQGPEEAPLCFPA